jgi:hypothetical protein
MARTTMAQLEALIASQAAAIASLTDALATVAPAAAAPSEASQHFADRDIPCTHATPCEKTFRTAKGRDWHVANTKHEAAKA